MLVAISKRARAALRKAGTLNLQWDEQAHPRGEAGQFTNKPGDGDGNASGLDAQLGRRKTLPKNEFGVEDLHFEEADQQEAPYSYRVQRVAEVIGDIMEPMAMWVLTDDMVGKLRDECIRTGDEVGLMMVDIHRNVRESFSQRERDEARKTIIGMLRQAVERQKAGDGGDVQKAVPAARRRPRTLLEAFLLPGTLPAALGGAQEPQAQGAGGRVWAVLKAAGAQLGLFDETKHQRHPKGSPKGGQFAPKGEAKQPALFDAGGEHPATTQRRAHSRAFIAPGGEVLPLTNAQSHRGFISENAEALREHLGADDPHEFLLDRPTGKVRFGPLLRHGFVRKTHAPQVVAYSASAEAPDTSAVARRIAADLDAEIDDRLSRGWDIDDTTVRLSVPSDGGPVTEEWSLGELAEAGGRMAAQIEGALNRAAPDEPDAIISDEEDEPEEEVREVGGSYQDRVDQNMEHLETQAGADVRREVGAYHEAMAYAGLAADRGLQQQVSEILDETKQEFAKAVVVVRRKEACA